MLEQSPCIVYRPVFHLVYTITILREGLELYIQVYICQEKKNAWMQKQHLMNEMLFLQLFHSLAHYTCCEWSDLERYLRCTKLPNCTKSSNCEASPARLVISYPVYPVYDSIAFSVHTWTHNFDSVKAMMPSTCQKCHNNHKHSNAKQDASVMPTIKLMSPLYCGVIQQNICDECQQACRSFVTLISSVLHLWYQKFPCMKYYQNILLYLTKILPSSFC